MLDLTFQQFSIFVLRFNLCLNQSRSRKVARRIVQKANTLVYERQTVVLSFCWNRHRNPDASTLHVHLNLAGSFVRSFSRSVTYGLGCICSSHVLYCVIKTSLN